ncbi:MAG: hypothetical protein M1832_005272 [Thelocarpon impressellum]|nr:MAG: hypothetical protein M1832_005272 [Thelocarpon impressellum]
MNVSQPVASSIGSVEFAFLSADEIKALSVKRIQNPTTFDTLLNPVPGGLYDPALGASGDNPCATCNLGLHTCPGHAGHVELPVPVYHPTFMDQLFRLLRAKCSYCHHLRLSRMEVNRFLCKLRLIQHGLLNEADTIDDIHLVPKSGKETLDGTPGSPDGSEIDDSEEDDTNDIIRRRIAFVNRAIIGRGIKTRGDARSVVKKEAVAEERRAVIKDFLAAIIKGKKCATCNGISPSFRRDKFVKIFQRALGDRDYAQMVQGGFKMTNAAVLLNKQRKKALEKRKQDRMDVDEGIGADISTDEGEDLNDGESLEMADDLMEDSTNLITKSKSSKASDKDRAQRYVNPSEVHAALTLLFEKEQDILSLVYSSRVRSKTEPPVTADMLFIRCTLVPPNRFRPEAKTGDAEIAEAQQNSLYKLILTRCDMINQIHKEMTALSSGGAVAEGARQRNVNDLQETWVRLQDAVNSLIDRDRNPIQGAAGKKNEDGIKQKLEKKEGLFRKNMMGKRVNFAARSVISPDPNIETNEIGVPPVFAKKLTYPEPVTNYNFHDLKEAVLNGVGKWPGAAAIENENGQVINLRTKNFEERQALANQLLAPSSTAMKGAKNKKVHRHLNNGDVVLMNRQPTLHKPSIMGHRARVLPGEKTIRMHYANCNTYNADFDGDEMNMHFPQNEIARAEALQIADTDHQYLVATDGKPLRGLIQDHLSMGLWMSNRDTFFDRQSYQQLLYSCLRPEDNHTNSDRILTVPPAIVKPKALWTGKQVFTTIMMNVKPPSYPGLTLTSKSTTRGSMWARGSEEDFVLFKDGYMLCGILDKAQLGPSAGGLVHSVYEVYGHSIAGKLLSVIGRLLTKFLHMRAFTCGMDDLVLTKTGEKERREELKRVDEIGLQVAAKYVGLTEREPDSDDPELRSRLEEVLRDGDKQAGLDIVMNSKTKDVSTDITTACLPDGLAKPFPRNQMQAMTTSGAKGTPVNANLISCNLGQQVLEGRRVPTMISGKTLPCFKPFETNVRAGGYVADRFLTGIRPQEYFFHCMAGREGLIDTAVKTSRSGYLQRCLIKGMEGLRVEYDDSIRDSDGTVIQFLYGEDGLDVTKQKHLMDFRFVAENFMSHFEQLNVREEFQQIATDDALEWNKAAMRKVKKTGRIDAMDPVLARFSPSRTPYSTSETFTMALKRYQDENPEKLLRDKKNGIEGPLTKKAFEMVLNLKYLKSVVEPGEAVGIVAGQSVGEPSTQMTLNTFHLAGHSTKNVTLGIPRLREIVMTASKHISTPTMTLYLNPELKEGDGETFAKVISKLTLGEVIDYITVSERVGEGVAYGRSKIYHIRIEFFPSEEYRTQYAIEVEDVARTLEKAFVPRLQKLTRAELKKKGEEATLKSAAQSDALPQIGESVGVVEEASGVPEADREGGEDDNDDGDATNTKQRSNRAEAISYEAPDEDEELIATQARRETTPELEMEDEGIGGSPKESAHSSDEDDDDSMDGISAKSRKQDARAREDRIKAKCSDVASFRFDYKGGQWCELQLEYPSTTPKLLMLSLVESSCRGAIIQAIPGLNTASVIDDKTSKAPVVQTEGVNLMAMLAYQSIINPHRIFTNDIASMLEHYGVEACRATIIREMDAVFKGHSIAVNNRHLNLIADMMTRGGGFLPFNRNGLKSSVSPFLKMSFETTVGFMREAALERDWDDLASPSGRIVLGKVARVGTGAFDVLLPPS